MGNFVHLHLHSEYSLLDGICRLTELPDAAKKCGMDAIALTDHGNMYGAVEFFKSCKKSGIKPIIGCEVYLAPTSRLEKTGRVSPYHLVLLCENEEGYKNLSKLVSKAYTEGFYSKPRVDVELLTKYHGGLIALSGCLKGAVAQAISENDYEGAEKWALRFRDIFGENNFYLEVQNHGIDGQDKINRNLRILSDRLSIPLVATNDVHYIEKKDCEVQAVSLCIQSGTTLDNAERFKFDTDQCYFKTREEMLNALPDFEDAIDNTAKIAERCNFEFEFGKYKLPAYDTGCELSPKEYLEKLCNDGFAKRNIPEDKAEKYKLRMNSELEVIEKTGFIDYFLIVWDFVNFAKTHGIPVGPGRGSGVGSLCAYLLKITEVDPIEYELYFERFLTTERVSMPDFDIDFSDERRDEMIKYVASKYGEDHVSQIITFGTLAACAAVRDVGRAMGMPYSEVDEVAKAVRAADRTSLVNSLKESDTLKSMYENSRDIKKLIDMAIRLEGLPRNASTHASGVLITPSPCDEYVPLAVNGDTVLTQYTMNAIAELGLLKIDFLGLRYLTIVDHAIKTARKKDPDLDVNNIPLDDKNVYNMFSKGLTEGVFQFESAGIKSKLIMVAPKNIEDIISVVSLYRPGPMDAIDDFVKNRKNPDKIEYLHPLLEPILKTTYGCVIYQEQVMQIFRTLAGYSLGRADIVRRMMAKKQQEKMARERRYFIYGDPNGEGGSVCDGTLAHGLTVEKSEEIFSKLIDFSNYGFNKSHAASYGILAYKTAYLKYHYPAEYMCSLLTNSFTEKIPSYVTECSSLGIKVLSPDVNESNNEFSVEGNNIRFGFCGIKSLGDGFSARIVRERELGKFTSFENFVRRMSDRGINKKHLEALIKSGACDVFNMKRSVLLLIYELLLDKITEQNSKNIAGQLDMFADGTEDENPGFEYPDRPELPIEEMLSMEKEMTGFYFSGSPLSSFENHIKALGAKSPLDITEMYSEDGGIKEAQNVTVAGTVMKRRDIRTKNGDKMSFISIDNMYCSIEVIVFPKVLKTCDRALEIGAKIAVCGKTDKKEDEDVKILASTVTTLIPNSQFTEVAPKTEQNSVKNAKLYLKVPSLDDSLTKKALGIVGIFDGNTDVVLYLSDEKKYVSRKDKVEISDYVIKQFKELLGDGSVVLK